MIARVRHLVLACPAVLVGMVVTAAPLGAQQRPDPAEAWTAARATMLQLPQAPDSMRIVADTASMYAKFATCRDDGPTPSCMLTDPEPVAVLRVLPVTNDSVVVEFRRYETLRGRCPTIRPLGAPRIAETGGYDFSMIYRDGQWIPSGMMRGFAC